MKRFIKLFVICILCMAVCCGCGLNTKPVSLESSMEIPEDGIISAEIFKKLKEENKVITFYGISGDIKYEWTIFGEDIQEPKDTNLKVEVEKDKENRLVFRLCSEEELGFMPVLSLYSAHLWQADSAVVYRKGEKEPLCSVSVTGNKTSVLNFSVAQIGEFDIKGEKTAVLEAETTAPEKDTQQAVETDPYLSDGKANGGQALSNEKDDGGRVLSDGKQEGQDQYKTDPVPEGKPLPVEPENQDVDEEQTYTCTFSIECSTILNNLEDLNEDKLDVLPTDGVILSERTVTFYEGESVYDVLKRICQENDIHMESSWTPMYNSAYVEGIHNLYEFDCGSGSGWMYRVNGWYPNYGCSRYQLAQGDKVEWRYTCDLGADIGGGYSVGS